VIIWFSKKWICRFLERYLFFDQTFYREVEGKDDLGLWFFKGGKWIEDELSTMAIMYSM
jgi:hypothetical protein